MLPGRPAHAPHPSPTPPSLPLPKKRFAARTVLHAQHRPLVPLHSVHTLYPHRSLQYHHHTWLTLRPLHLSSQPPPDVLLHPPPCSAFHEPSPAPNPAPPSTPCSRSIISVRHPTPACWTPRGQSSPNYNRHASQSHRVWTMVSYRVHTHAFRRPGSHSSRKPLSALQACNCSAMHFQVHATEFLPARTEAILIWLDESLLHGVSVEEQFKVIENSSHCVASIPLCQTAKARNPIARAATWGRREITPERIKMDPRTLEGLIKMPKPSTAGDLQHFDCAINWLRSSVPDARISSCVAAQTAPALDLLNEVVSKLGTKWSQLLAPTSQATFGVCRCSPRVVKTNMR